MKNVIISIVVCIVLFGVTFSFSSCSGTEVFITDGNSEVITLVGNDSLYIDTYESGCGISAYKLHKVGHKEWDGECLTFNPINDEEPTIITERIKIEHIYRNRYAITFNGSEVYYMCRINL